MFTNINPTFAELTAREWLCTNGLGGYASSTLAGANTRRYHGLLVAAFNPPADRRVLVSKVEEWVSSNGQAALPLASNSYPGTVYPEGYRLLAGYESKPLPRTIFGNGDFRIAKTVFMVHGSNTTVVEYHNEGAAPLRLELNPLFVCRDYHSTFHESDYFDYYFQPVEPRRLKIHAHYGAPPLFMDFSRGEFQPQAAWYNNFVYEKEQQRGLDFQEDARSIGQIVAELPAGERLFLIFTTDEAVFGRSPMELKMEEIKRLEGLAPATDDSFLRDLSVAGDQFLVRRRSTGSHSIIAGYHWFTDWGRDTMIAMRGLTVAAGKPEETKSILRTFLQYLDQGMLPNRFPDQGEAVEYNTFDATLWLFVALYEYYEKFGDLEFIAEAFPRLTEVIEAHLEGTRYHIHLTPEGLLFGGEGLLQLTWMDAKVGDYVVTPRQGCPVEINALWYNALRIYAFFAEKMGFPSETFTLLAARTEKAFRRFFLNSAGYLHDVVIPDGYTDDSIRPNQIYAISLHSAC